MTSLRDEAKEEMGSHSQELDEAKQLLQAARDEIAALQAALQAAQQPPAAASSEEVERTLEAAQQAESTAQQMRLEAHVVSRQAAAEVVALVGELESMEAALTQECQESRASLSALSMQVQEKILEPLMVHWQRVQKRAKLTQSGLMEQDAAAATDPGQQAGQAAASADVKTWDKPEFSLEDSSAQLPALLARDALERQLLLQALAQAEDDAAVREPQLAVESVIGPDVDVLAGLRAEALSATAAAAASNQATILAAVLFEDLATAKLQHKRERLNQRAQLAQSQAGEEIAQDAERELASLLETVASERQGVQAQLRDLEGQLEAASAAQREAQERLQAALGGDDGDDGEVSELLVANRLLLAKVQTSEKEVCELTAELKGVRAELAGAHKGDASLDLSCVILTNEMRRAEAELEERVSTARQLFQDALSAQVPPALDPCPPAVRDQTPTPPLQPLQRDLAVADLRKSALRMSRLDVRFRLMQASTKKLFRSALPLRTALPDPLLRRLVAGVPCSPGRRCWRLCDGAGLERSRSAGGRDRCRTQASAG